MSCVTRALCYICRKKVKSILLLFLLLAINCMILSTLGIREVSIKLAKDLGKNAESKVILECMNSQQLFVEGDVQVIADMDNINWMNRLSEWKAGIYNCAPVSGEEDSEPLFYIHGYDKLENDSPFAEKVGRLVEGNYPQEKKEIVMNQFLAEHNGIRIGDRIYFQTADMKKQEAVIAGLFLTGMERSQTENVATVNRIENQIYGTTDFVNMLSGSKFFQQLVVYVNNPEQLTATKEALEKRYYDKAAVGTKDHTFQKLKRMLGQMERVTLLIFLLTVLVGNSVTGLLFAMWMRGRKTEIAVLVSLGITKGDILVQMLFERGVLYTVSFIAAGTVTGFILPIIGKSLDIMQGSGLVSALSFGWMAGILGVGLVTILILTTITIFPYIKKPVKEIFSEMEG